MDFSSLFTNPLGSLLGIGANLFGQSNTNKMQAEMMQQQQSFQEHMSSTAYQRASKDMQAAGLNPMMMFSSGSAASTPAGAAPSPMVKSGLDADAMQKSIATATQQKIADATVAKLKAETLTELERPLLVKSDTYLRRQQGDTEVHRARRTDAEADVTRHEVPIMRNRALTAANEERIQSTARRLLDQTAFGGRKASDTLSPVSDIVSSAGKVRRLFDDRWSHFP